MSIIITGLGMPTERESFNLTIKYNGLVFDTESGMQVAEAHELPPHGRLADLDALVDKHFGKAYLERAMTASKCEMRTALVNIPLVINNAPTIIPAEEGE